MPDIDAAKLLTQALSLVSNDIGHIEKMSKRGKLEHQDAQDLVRYATLLGDILDKDDEDAEKTKKKLRSHNTAELIKMWQDLNKGKS